MADQRPHRKGRSKKEADDNTQLVLGTNTLEVDPQVCEAFVEHPWLYSVTCLYCICVLTLPPTLPERGLLHELIFRQHLLGNLKLIPEVCKKIQDLNEFVPFLYAYFEANSQGNQLIKWAITTDVQEAAKEGIITRVCMTVYLLCIHAGGISSLCRNETLMTRLFFVEFFGDLGKRYVLLLFTTKLLRLSLADT